MKHLNLLAALALLSGGFALPLAGQEKSQEKSQAKSVVDYSKSGHEAVFVPEDVDLLGEKVLPLDAAPMEIGMNTANTLNARGMRLFVLMVKPGQTIKATLKATPLNSYFINWVLLEDRSHPLYSRVKLASENQLSRQASFISFKNTSPFPLQLAFHISGLADNPYSVKLERK